jgi:hypothetical protein
LRGNCGGAESVAGQSPSGLSATELGVDVVVAAASLVAESAAADDAKAASPPPPAAAGTALPTRTRLSGAFSASLSCCVDDMLLLQGTAPPQAAAPARDDCGRRFDLVGSVSDGQRSRCGTLLVTDRIHEGSPSRDAVMALVGQRREVGAALGE